MNKRDIEKLTKQ